MEFCGSSSGLPMDNLLSSFLRSKADLPDLRSGNIYFYFRNKNTEPVSAVTVRSCIWGKNTRKCCISDVNLEGGQKKYSNYFPHIASSTLD